MADFMIGIVVLLAIGAAVAYIIKEKKRGVKCIGCPAAGTCSRKNNGSAEHSCGCQSDAH